MAKDRAAPFSKKHRKYWIPVLGGMLLIGFFNLGLGVCTYKRPGDPEPIRLSIPTHDASIVSVTPGQIPAEIMRAFVDKYPQTVPLGANMDGENYVIVFPPGAAKQRATFRPDGTFVADE